MNGGGPGGASGDLADRPNDQDRLILVETTIAEFAPHMAFLGVSCEAAGAGHVRLRLPFSRECANHLGVVDASVAVAFAQFAGTVALWCALPRGIVPYASGVTTAAVRPVRSDLIADVAWSMAECDRILAEIVAEPRVSQRITLSIATDDGDAPPVLRAALTYRFLFTGTADPPRL